MLGFIKRFLGDNNDKEIARLRPVVEQITALEPQMQSLTDEPILQNRNEEDGDQQRHYLDDIIVRS